MLKNYFIIAWRNLLKNKLTSFINIFGLTVSIAICLLICLFIYDEVHYDTFQKDYTQIYRLEQNVKTDNGLKHWAATSPPLHDLLENFPEIESVTRIIPTPNAFIKTGEKKFKEDNSFLADASVFDVMGLTLLQGDPKTALTDPGSVVLTEKTANTLFRSVDVLNATFLINSRPCKVTGILKDLPANSHLQITLLRPVNLLKKLDSAAFGRWYDNSLYTYIRVKKNTSVPLLTDKIADALVAAGISIKKGDNAYQLHAVSDIHLDDNIEKELSRNSSWTFIYIFITIGVLVLLLASINYINLTTSRSLGRSKEIGVRKTLGAFKKNLITQFIAESVFITLLSFFIGIALVFFFLPSFNVLTGKTLSMAAISSPAFIFVCVGIVIFVGIIAGSYPAFVIASFDPVTAIKGNTDTKNNPFSFGLRKSLVVFQFVVSAFLVISSIVVIRQISYVFNKQPGFDKEHVMVLPAISLTPQTLNTFRSELLGSGLVTDVGATASVPGKRVFLEGIYFTEDKMETIRSMSVDEDYLSTMKVELFSGRFFSRNRNDSSSVILNEAAVKYFHLKDPLGQKVVLWKTGITLAGTIVGVVKDFHQGSLHTEIEPMVFHIDHFYNYITVRYKGELEPAKRKISETWAALFPDHLFTYSMLDNDLQALYKPESTLKKVLIIFTSLAIIIAVLGLFGLIFFANTLRRKEIGIRKVLGADNKGIIFLLSKEYIFLIVLSLLISIPLSNYAMNKWLTSFAYRITISPLIFVEGIAITLLIALSTVLVQGARAALANPIKSIKTE